MRPTGQIPFSLQSVNRQRLTDGYVPPAISGQWLIDELGWSLSSCACQAKCGGDGEDWRDRAARGNVHFPGAKWLGYLG